MIRLTNAVLAMSLAGLTLTGAGCDDQKNELAQLRQSNQQLLDELQGCREELASCREANDACQNELSRARAQVSELMNRPAPQPIIQPAPQPTPQPPPGWTPVPGGAMIALDSSVLFDSGKVALKSDAKRSLEQVLQALQSTYRDKRVYIVGHTDDEPIKKSGWRDNYELSAQRGLAVVRWFKERGLEARRLTACGCGEYQPKVPNTTDTNRKQNRRVEVYALDAEIRPAG